ncbi:hypothetical protein TWF694_001138 [Orbilia ellipsospora]|uniref:Uncharacterized protein n=1 Tax=Orbilia ellipsospora TaxID=2528407 RepID=A0AAV9XXC3_9PEZI
MSERVRRYIPSFKRRRTGGGGRSSQPSLWDGSDDSADHKDGSRTTATGASQDMDIALERMRQLQAQKERAPLLPRHQQRQQLVRRQLPRPNPVRELIDEVVDPAGGNNNGGSVTVTVSIGLSLQITTISQSGTTFVSTMSTSWFTFDASGHISSSPPTATPDPNSNSNFTSPASSNPTPPAGPTSTAPTVGSPPSSPLTLPTPTPISTGEVQAPKIYSSTTLTSVPSIIQSLAPNMTDYNLTKTRTTKPTVTITDHLTSKHASCSSSIPTSSSLTLTTTVFPADSEPTTPLETSSPTIDGSDGPDAGSGSGTSMNEKLPPILGGIFGGLAGLGLVLWAILFLLRKKRRGLRGGGILGGPPGGGHTRAISQDTAGGSLGEMSQPRNSLMPGFIATGAGLFGARSSADTTSAPPTERGFVKIAGRKLPSMYGDDMIPTNIAVAGVRASHSASESGSRNVSGGTHPTAGTAGSTKSFIQDDEILPAPASNPFAPSTARAAMRTGSPSLVGRIAEDEPEAVAPRPQSQQPPPPPMIYESAEGSSRYPTPPPGAVRRMHSLVGTDAVGRSLASQDGSKTSRFTEDV